MAGLEATSDAARAGEFSPEQLGAVADASAVNPDAEADLLDRARRDSLRRTREEAERRKAEVRSEQDKVERERRVRAERDVRFWYGNGAGHMQADGPIADIKQLEQRLQREVDKAFRANRDPSKRQSRGNYAFDALMTMGDADGGSTKGSRPSLTRMTLIRVDLAALQRGRAEGGELCEIGGIAVSVTELRSLLGDSLLQLVLTNGEAVVDLVNLNRKPTVAQKIAKLFGDATCCVEGCDRAARLEFDHRHDWVLEFVTELENLDLLCDHHHDLKTYQGWRLVDGTGRRPMVPPADPRHPDHHPAADTSTAQATAESRPPADLIARLQRIRRNEADHHARLAGQDTLFDTG
jgi:hypothetical protein